MQACGVQSRAHAWSCPVHVACFEFSCKDCCATPSEYWITKHKTNTANIGMTSFMQVHLPHWIGARFQTFEAWLGMCNSSTSPLRLRSWCPFRERSSAHRENGTTAFATYYTHCNIRNVHTWHHGTGGDHDLVGSSASCFSSFLEQSNTCWMQVNSIYGAG